MHDPIGCGSLKMCKRCSKLSVDRLRRPNRARFGSAQEPATCLRAHDGHSQTLRPFRKPAVRSTSPFRPLDDYQTPQARPVLCGQLNDQSHHIGAGWLRCPPRRDGRIAVPSCRILVTAPRRLRRLAFRYRPECHRPSREPFGRRQRVRLRPPPSSDSSPSVLPDASAFNGVPAIAAMSRRSSADVRGFASPRQLRDRHG
jgi:hypothetical protein